MPHVLFEECITTLKVPGPNYLIRKAETIIKAGAYISLSLGRMITTERNTLHALDSIIDKLGTEQIRDNSIESLQIDFHKEALECNKSIMPLVKYAQVIALKFWNTLSEKHYSKEWRQSGKDNDLNIRYKKWAEAFGEEMMQSYVNRLCPGICPHIQNNWITWHLIRLILIYGVEWSYTRNKSGQSYEVFNITNDVYDIGYILCLARSDMLFSQDKKLIALAKAIFPQRTFYTDNNINL